MQPRRKIGPYTQIRLSTVFADAIREHAHKKSMSVSEFIHAAVSEKLERSRPPADPAIPPWQNPARLPASYPTQRKTT